ncbi:hypothetical protein [Arthrobacter sp. SAFR-014]
MNAEQRDKLLDLHREAVNMMASGDITAYTAADDAFRDYLMRLEITE